MAFLFNFNTTKPKRFNYRPLYYDERKERLEKMKARAEADLAAEKDKVSQSGLERGFLSERRTNSKYRSTSLEKQSTLRFFIILAALLGLLYWIMPELFLEFWRSK
jgi:hypothetical protein